MTLDVIEQPDILKPNNDFVRLWTLYKGSMKNLPSQMDGDNLVALFQAIDHELENFRYNKNYRIASRQIEDYNAVSLNGTELNDRLKMLGVPFIEADKSISKKRRLDNWLKYFLGGGSEASLLTVVYTFIGEDTFVPSEGEVIPKDTTRIRIRSLSDQYLWSSSAAPIPEEFSWVEEGLSDEDVLLAGGGFWVDGNTLSDADFDIQIFFLYSGVYTDERDITFWQSGTNIAKIMQLVDKTKPAGSSYTITLIYDGA